MLAKNPAYGIRAAVVTSPAPDLLFENECKRLLNAASRDPRAYLLVLLLLETGIKKAKLLELRVGNFDFSNKYQPELWVKHSGKQVTLGLLRDIFVAWRVKGGMKLEDALEKNRAV